MDAIALRAMKRFEITIQPVPVWTPAVVPIVSSRIVLDDSAIISKHGHEGEMQPFSYL